MSSRTRGAEHERPDREETETEVSTPARHAGGPSSPANLPSFQLAYRAEFETINRTSSFDGLIKKVQEKNA